MGVGLPPLDFTECLSDSPNFRENLHKHEKELENTNQQIKRLIKEVKDLLEAAKTLSNAQRSFAKGLQSFTFECIGESKTDDEIIISRSLNEFGKLINLMEDERDRMLKTAHERVTVPLEKFRKQNIAEVKNGKKKFDKQTSKFCQTQERHLNLTTKKQNSLSLQEADASVDMAERHFYNASMDYVYLIQEVHERKKFEFVESLLSFMFGWLTFYHQGHETAKDFNPYMNDLQFRIQKTRDNFEDYRQKLKKRMAEIQKQSMEEPVRGTKGEKSGYLFLLEKKAFGATWTKHYCTYNKERKEFSMVPYNQLTTKSLIEPDIMVLASCVRRMSESIEKRFCFDLQTDSKPGSVFTFQALSESDRKAWLDIMDGKEPTYTVPVKLQNAEERLLDDIGIQFMNRCIEVLDTRGLEEQGMYRVVGVMSKVSKLLNMGLDRRKAADKLAGLDDPQEWETKTITSALKCYLRNLPEPIMTYRYHNGFIAAVKNETRPTRINDVHTLVYRLPSLNFEVLKILIKHLNNVASKSDKNLMTISNLSVCFGPTLLRPEEETVASIVDLKFYNVVVEILIENYERIFNNEPPPVLVGLGGVVGVGGVMSPGEGDMSAFKMAMQQQQQQQQLELQQTRPAKTIRNYSTNQPTQYKIQAFYDPSPPPPHQPHPLSTSLYNVNDPPPPSHVLPTPTQQSNGTTVYANINNQSAALISSKGGADNNQSALMTKADNQSALMTKSDNQSAMLMTKSDYTHNNSGGSSNGGSGGIGGMGAALLPPLQHKIMQYMNQTVGTQSESNIANMRGYGVSPSSFIAYSHLEPNSTSSSNESVSSNSRDGGTGYLNNHMSPEKPHSNRSNSVALTYAQHYRPVGAVIPFNTSSARSSPTPTRVRRVRTLYACVGENDGELSFEPNQIITNVEQEQLIQNGGQLTNKPTHIRCQVENPTNPNHLPNHSEHLKKHHCIQTSISQTSEQFTFRTNPCGCKPELPKLNQRIKNGRIQKLNNYYGQQSHDQCTNNSKCVCTSVRSTLRQDHENARRIVLSEAVSRCLVTHCYEQLLLRNELLQNKVKAGDDTSCPIRKDLVQICKQKGAPGIDVETQYSNSFIRELTQDVGTQFEVEEMGNDGLDGEKITGCTRCVTKTNEPACCQAAFALLTRMGLNEVPFPVAGLKDEGAVKSLPQKGMGSSKKSKKKTKGKKPAKKKSKSSKDSKTVRKKASKASSKSKSSKGSKTVRKGASKASSSKQPARSVGPKSMKKVTPANKEGTKESHHSSVVKTASGSSRTLPTSAQARYSKATPTGTSKKQAPPKAITKPSAKSTPAATPRSSLKPTVSIKKSTTTSAAENPKKMANKHPSNAYYVPSKSISTSSKSQSRNNSIVSPRKKLDTPKVHYRKSSNLPPSEKATASGGSSWDKYWKARDRNAPIDTDDLNNSLKKNMPDSKTLDNDCQLVDLTAVADVDADNAVDFYQSVSHMDNVMYEPVDNIKLDYVTNSADDIISETQSAPVLHVVSSEGSLRAGFEPIKLSIPRLKPFSSAPENATMTEDSEWSIRTKLTQDFIL